MEEYEDRNLKPKEEEGGMKPGAGQALAAFILCVVGFHFAVSYYFSFVGMILGIVSLAINRDTEQQPFKTFRKFAIPFGIVDVVLGAILSFVWLIAAFIALISATFS